MILLAVDTALEACSAAVVDGDRALALHSEPMTRGHQERLAPMVAEAMAEAALPFDRLARIVVTTGPGSFTGLRVGLAFARAMALALDVPCVGVGALQALLASAPDAATAPLAAAVLDARRGQVYVQAFRRGAPVAEPANLPLAEAQVWLRSLGADEATPMVGTGATLLSLGACVGQGGVDVLALARLGAAGAVAGRPPAPLYLRAPDARTIAERAALGV